MSLNTIPTKPVKSSHFRVFKCIFRQKSKTRICPDLPSLAGKNVLITGGMAGVGEFISRKLLGQGANVVSISRGVTEGTGLVPGIETIGADLSNPGSVKEAVDKLENKKFDILICNAGVVSSSYEKTSIGLEKTFAVNVFGQHILYRLLINRKMLAENARVVLTSGEIYVMAKDCTSDVKSFKSDDVYAQTKLGNLWQVLELAKRYPNIHPIAVHPGVVASNFAGNTKKGFGDWIRRKLLVTEEEGAQAALIAATQDIPRGAYWHNVMGVVDLNSDDVALDSQKSFKLWSELEILAKPWL